MKEHWVWDQNMTASVKFIVLISLFLNSEFYSTTLVNDHDTFLIYFPALLRAVLDEARTPTLNLHYSTSALSYTYITLNLPFLWFHIELLCYFVFVFILTVEFLGQSWPIIQELASLPIFSGTLGLRMEQGIALTKQFSIMLLVLVRISKLI